MLLNQMNSFLAIYLVCFENGLSKLSPEERDCKTEGQQVPLKNAWYVCRMEMLVPVACITSSGARVDIGQSYVQGQQLVKCTQTSPSTVVFRAVGCFMDGQMLMARQTGHNDRYWFVCSLDGKVAVKVEKQKCVGENGTVVEPGETFKRGSIEYKCAEARNKRGVSVEPTACELDGQKYGIDEEIASKDGFWYKCIKTDPETAIIQIKGCVINGKKLQDGESFDAEGFRQTCRTKPILNEKDVREVQAGMSCLEFGPGGSKINHPVGSTWTVGNGIVKYMVQCTQDQLRISQRMWRCIYDGPEGKFEVESGCYKKFSGIVFHCSIKNWRDGDAAIIHGANQETEHNLQNSGLKLC